MQLRVKWLSTIHKHSQPLQHVNKWKKLLWITPSWLQSTMVSLSSYHQPPPPPTIMTIRQASRHSCNNDFTYASNEKEKKNGPICAWQYPGSYLYLFWKADGGIRPVFMSWMETSLKVNVWIFTFPGAHFMSFKSQVVGVVVI